MTQPTLRLSMLCFMLLSCQPVEGPKSGPPPSRALPSEVTSSAPMSTSLATSGPASLPQETQVAVIEPAAVQALEANGFSLGELSVGTKATTTEELSKTALKSIFAAISRDVSEAAKAQPPARVTSVDGFRIFDVAWLNSKELRFELVGLFNRLDRRAFVEGSCGEVRFLYRLSYQTTQGGEPMASRLPLMINVVFLVRGDCQSVARAWQSPKDISGKELADWLVSKGPLTTSARTGWELKAIETDLQRLRIQSGAHASLAGHIEYGMFVFYPVDKTRFAPAPMENMPDVKRLKKDIKLRSELLAYLQSAEVLQAIDQGVLRLPERFLATQATSFSPRGLSRVSNRPFKQLFSAKDFEGLALSGMSTIQSPAALLRRLDGASCTGCHQSRGIAGFHFVGEDGPDEPKGAGLWSGMSPHLMSDLERRRGYVEAVAAGKTPDEHRPSPERQGAGHGVGAPCGLGDEGFAAWSCAEGLRCQSLEDSEVGECIDEGRLSAPCEFGTLHDQPKPQQDYVTKMLRPSCGPALSCDVNKQGFPLGSCSGSCSAKLPGLACADFIDIDTLQACLRRDGSYSSCNAASMLAVGERACDQENPCRQDYVCAKTSSATQGACVPPYFVFPLRLDGYPLQQ